MSELAQQLIAENKRTQAKSLDLGNCGLRDLEKEVPELFDCVWLEELMLSDVYWDYEKQEKINNMNNGLSNSFVKIPMKISMLKHLKKININGWNSHWKITNINFVENLTQLEVLTLRCNRISDLRPLEKLTQLQTLDLRLNKIKNIRFLKNLTQLKYLDISINNISDLSSLRKLSKLQTLNLQSNKIRDIEVLESLIKLDTINLSTNYIEILKINNLQFLNEINVKNNPIREVSLYNLTELKELILSHLELKSVDLNNLKNLHVLTINNIRNKKRQCLYQLKKLPSLQYLDFSSSHIWTIHFLKNINTLRYLDLSLNSISDISYLEKLTQLQYLNLYSNQISYISPILPLIKKGIPTVLNQDNLGKTIINLGINPLFTPPIEIVSQGNEAILRYFGEKERSGADFLYEAKVLLVGEGNAGKTTLRKKLENVDADMPPAYARTSGIDISRIPFQHTEKRNFFLNIWDFGGQDIYHNTHHFFLTKRSLYVLVTNTRSQEDNFDYWIPNIRLFGGKSPILIVKNKWQDAVKGSSIDRKISITRFRQNEAFNIPENLLEVNLYTKENLDKLSQTILHHATQLPLVGSEVPKSWVDVRNALKEKSATQAHILFSDFAVLCQKTGIEESEKISDLARFFHDLGIVLWYEEIPALKSRVILQPEWATDAVYLIINDEQIQNQKGHFSYQDLERIWADPRHQDMCHELLEMMKEFRLCYQKRSRKKAFIIPSLLSPEPPTLQWNSKDNIQLQYEYSFMPKGIVNQLSAELHTYIQKDGHIWGQGVVLTDKSGLFKAKIEEDWFNRKIDIRTSGPDARAILRRITDTIENDIHQYFPGVDFKKFVPCFCSACQTSETPEFYAYDSLLKVLQRSPTFFCNIGGDSFDIQKALFNIGETPHNASDSDSPFEEKRRRKSNDSKQSKKAKKLFISYSTEDEAYLEGLKKQLAILDRKGELVTWDDTCLFAGENWSEQTEVALKEADMILLLVSSDFLANEQIDEIEVATALRLKEIGKTCIVPIVIRPCMWKRSDFAKYSVLPSKGKPISKWDDKDEAWLNVVEGIAELL